MKKELILGICITAFVAIAAWAPNVLAYQNYRAGNNQPQQGCNDCHTYRPTTHDLHRQTMGISCGTCHINGGTSAPIPIASTCAVSCHDPAPLQSNHVNVYGATVCSDCHYIAPSAETNCSDGIDNNNNGLTDCVDPDCNGFVIPGQTTCGQGACASTGNLECRNLGQFDTCQAGNPQAEGPFDDASCSDAVDNDCDGATDASDSDCVAPPETCDDGVDNNGNGLVDCADPQCDGFAFNDTTTCGVGACASTGSTICQGLAEFDTCQPYAPQSEGPFGDASCSDGVDNDCDGTNDAGDTDCAAPPETCDDGVDNNGNGLFDCADPQCDGFDFNDVTTCGVGACASTGSTVCQNLDAFDTCQPDAAGNEGPYGDPSCSDTIDNNCNNLTDDLDPNCQPGPETCDNNIDDNGDGLVDCADPQCEGFTGQPGSCTTSLPGICAAGTLSCDLGETFCNQDNQPGTEGPYNSPNCTDGLDNDCDGATDASDSNCDPPSAVCGNGTEEAGEECDDGNTTSGDGCSATCQTETQDCAGTWGGTATVDNCGVCDSDPTNDCTQDCAGTWGGTATVDNCGVCDSDPTNDCTQDCAGTWGGTATADNCGVCDSDPTNDCTQDCAGAWGGTATVDNCGVCDSDPTNDCTVTPPTGGCSEGDLPFVTEMEYNRGDEKLHLHGAAPDGTLTVVNADTGETLADNIRVREFQWEAEIKDVDSSLEAITIITSGGCSVNYYIGPDNYQTEDDEKDVESDYIGQNVNSRGRSKGR